MTSLILDMVYRELGLKANKMYWITLLLTLSVCMHGAHSDTISIKVGDRATQTYDSGASLEVQVGTTVLLIVGIDCEWNWDILNPISQSLTTQSGWSLKYLHIVPFTRAEMGVYSCDYFSTKLNLTLVATGTNLFRSYGGTSIQGEMNNSVVLAKIHSEVNIQIHCVQSEVLRDTGGYWIGPDGNEVGLDGSVYVREETVSGESVLLVQATSGDNVTEGVYTCTTDDNASYTVLLYRDLYSVVRGNGERELLNDTVEIVFVSVGEEISLVCPRGTVADYQGKFVNCNLKYHIVYLFVCRRECSEDRETTTTDTHPSIHTLRSRDLQMQDRHYKQSRRVYSYRLSSHNTTLSHCISQRQLYQRCKRSDTVQCGVCRQWELHRLVS